MRYRTLAAQIPAITYLWTRSLDDPPYGGTRYVSSQVETVLGFTPEQWTSAPDFWITRLHPADRERVVAAAARAIDTGEPFSVEYRLLAADGRVVWIRDEGRVIAHDERGRPLEWQGIMLDVTEHERAQHERRSAEARLRAVVEQVPAIVYVETAPAPERPAELVYVSPQLEAILGYRPDEVLGNPEYLASLLHPDDRARVMDANARALRDGLPFDEEYRAFTKDGRVVWLHSRATRVAEGDEGVYWQGVALDVTDRHALSDAMRDLEARVGARRTDADTSDTRK
jgi:PAS domain S-box-containing protein